MYDTPPPQHLFSCCINNLYTWVEKRIVRVSAVPKDTIQIPFRVLMGTSYLLICHQQSQSKVKLLLKVIVNNILINLSCLSYSFRLFLLGMDLEGLGSFGTQSEYKFKRDKEGWWCEVKRKGSELFPTSIFLDNVFHSLPHTPYPPIEIVSVYWPLNLFN